MTAVRVVDTPPRLSRPSTRQRAMTVFIVALSVRAIAGAALWTGLGLTGHTWLFPDENAFYTEAKMVAAHRYSKIFYGNLIGLLYRVFGVTIWLPRVLNVLAGSLLAVVVFYLVRRLASERAAIVAGITTALWPSLVLWSVLNLRDALIGLTLFAGVLGAVLLLDGRRAGLALALGSMWLVDLLRPYAFVVGALAIAAGTVVCLVRSARNRVVPATALLVGLGIVGLFGGQGFLGLGFVQHSTNTRFVAGVRGETSKGNTAIIAAGSTPKTNTAAGSTSEPSKGDSAVGSTDEPSKGDAESGSTEKSTTTTTPARGGTSHGLAVATEQTASEGTDPNLDPASVAKGVVFNNFGPFPWQAGTTTARLLLLVELPVWYLAVGLALATLWRASWDERIRWSVVIVVAIGVAGVLGVYLGNAGTAFRQRAMAVPAVVAIASACPIVDTVWGRVARRLNRAA